MLPVWTGTLIEYDTFRTTRNIVRSEIYYEYMYQDYPVEEVNIRSVYASDER